MTLLTNAELLADTGDDSPSANVAGLLLFGENVNRFLPQAGIDAVSYPGAESAAVGESGQREGRLAYPPDAVRETLVNALIHRDYLLSSTDIELSVYSDRIEVVSPGRLLNGITPDRMRVGCRAARNQLLKDVMRDYRYLEHMGMGVPRKIIRLMQTQNGTEPDLVSDGEQFAVLLWRGSSR